MLWLWHFAGNRCHPLHCQAIVDLASVYDNLDAIHLVELRRNGQHDK